MASELKSNTGLDHDFIDLFDRMGLASSEQKYKRIAFCLAGLASKDRNWILSQIPETDQSRVVAEIKSLKRLGIKVSPEMGRELLTTKRLNTLDSGKQFSKLADLKTDIASLALIAACTDDFDASSGDLDFSSKHRIEVLRESLVSTLPATLKETINRIGH
jgi:hypothetical protein